MTEPQSERFPAAKYLLDFIQDLTCMTEQLLAGVRRQMVGTVEEVMTSIERINNAAVNQKSKADEVLVKINKGDGATDSQVFASSTFNAVVAKDEERVNAQKETQDTVRLEILENNLRRAGGQFSKTMEAMSMLDDEIRTVLLQVIGALSSDDVIAQRVDHIVTSISTFNEGVAELLADFDSKLTMKSVKMFRNVLLTQIYKNFTTEDERETFHRIFGEPKRRLYAAA